MQPGLVHVSARAAALGPILLSIADDPSTGPLWVGRNIAVGAPQYQRPENESDIVTGW